MKGVQAIREVSTPPAVKIQHFKTMHFFNFFFLWAIFSHLDPDPHSQCESGTSRPKSVRIWIHNTGNRIRTIFRGVGTYQDTRQIHFINSKIEKTNLGMRGQLGLLRYCHVALER
jgi:hypothetical protein